MLRMSYELHNYTREMNANFSSFSTFINTLDQKPVLFNPSDDKWWKVDMTETVGKNKNFKITSINLHCTWKIIRIKMELYCYSEPLQPTFFVNLWKHEKVEKMFTLTTAATRLDHWADWGARKAGGWTECTSIAEGDWGVFLPNAGVVSSGRNAAASSNVNAERTTPGNRLRRGMAGRSRIAGKTLNRWLASTRLGWCSVKEVEDSNGDGPALEALWGTVRRDSIPLFTEDRSKEIPEVADEEQLLRRCSRLDKINSWLWDTAGSEPRSVHTEFGLRQTCIPPKSTSRYVKALKRNCTLWRDKDKKHWGWV